MSLNRKKCEYFAINPTNKEKITFEDGAPLNKSCKATYLGGNLQANGASSPEVEGRIAKAAHIFGKLKPLWKDAACTKAWKLRVFESVVLSVLFYGLDSVVLTKALRDRVDFAKPAHCEPPCRTQNKRHKTCTTKCFRNNGNRVHIEYEKRQKNHTARRRSLATLIRGATPSTLRCLGLPPRRLCLQSTHCSEYTPK